MTHLVPGDAAFPLRLKAASPAVARLWVEGRTPDATQPAIAVVGSRAASAAGCARAVQFAGQLVQEGYAIISGGAFGIDAAAHRGALDAGGPTFAVLGCGVDVIYPDRHASLFAALVAAGGGLLSEYQPGTAPRPGQFPARNRIIAALSDAVLVVEAQHRSGALGTARHAEKLGRPVLAVPGTVGTDALIAAGRALAVTSADDLRDALAGRRKTATTARVESDAGSASSIVTAAIATQPDHPAGLARRVGLPLPAVMAALTEAELDGRLRRSAGGNYEVCRGN